MKERSAPRARWLLWLLCASLSWSACQPYLDHQAPSFRDDIEAAGLGPKRPLELIDVRTGLDSVVFIFNQPLRLSTNDQVVPRFAARFRPPLEVRSTRYEGMAGVRVSFVAPLPLSSSFTAHLASGWRAPTGVSLRSDAQRRWTTPRPALLRVVTSSGLEVPLDSQTTRSGSAPGSSLTLIFNQPVELRSVRSALRWERITGGGAAAEQVPFYLTELAPSQGQMPHQTFLLRSRGTGNGTSHRLSLRPGVRSLKGPLPSVTPQHLLFQPPPALRFLGESTLNLLGPSLTLRFSAPVRAEEVARCLISLPETAGPQVSPSLGQPSTTVSLSFLGPVPQRLVLLAGLTSTDGSVLPEDLAIGLRSQSRASRSPLTATTLGFGRCERPFYRPSESVVLSGFTWHRPMPAASGQATIQVLSGLEHSVLETTAEVDSLGLFSARFAAPEEPGLYRVTMSLPNGEKFMDASFRVCPLAKFDESYRLEVETTPPGVVIGLRREGAQCRPVGVRAYLLPSKGTERLGDWTALSERTPHWYPLNLRSRADGAEYVGDLERAGGWSREASLVVEAFDRQEPSLILCRETRKLAPTRPHLELQVEQTGEEVTRQSVSVEVVDDGAALSAWPTTANARLLYRPSGSNSAWVEVGSRPLRMGAEKKVWPLHLMRAGDYQLRVDWTTNDETLRQAVWERSVHFATSVWPLDPRSDLRDLSLEIERRDQARELVRGGDDLNVRVVAKAGDSAWSGTLGWTRLPTGWDASRSPFGSSSLGQEVWSPPSPEGYPLLSAEAFDSASTWTGVTADPQAELEASAPRQAGSYLWSFLGRDSEGRFARAQTTLEVAEASRWEALVPWGVRSGDSFNAGLRFFAGSGESGPIGLVATATGQDSLLPSSYIRTDGVVKGGEEGVLRFAYQVPQKPPSASPEVVPLGWELGYQGLLASVRAEVPIWSSLPVAMGSGLRLLNPGGTVRIPVRGALAWRVALKTAGVGSAETLVSVDGPRGTLGQILLRAGDPVRTLEGGAPGTVQIRHLRGAPLSFQMFRLQPDLGQTRAWASDRYLFRALLDEQRRPITSLKLGQSASICVDLVTPARTHGATLRLPLPAGVMPLSVESLAEGDGSVPWRVESGAVVLFPEDLEPGEYRWLVKITAATSGDFLWPTARFLTSDGQLQALSGSNRVQILAP